MGVLSGMKLTHLGVESCVLLPAVGKDKMEFISLFQKCVHLEALESLVICDGCSSVFAKNGFSMLSYFPKLTYFNQLKAPNHFSAQHRDKL